MLFSRRELNIWPGFSDLMFMLAVSMLVVAGGVVVVVREQAKRQAAQEEKLHALGIDVDSRQPCGLSTPVIDDLRACLERNAIHVESRGCSLVVKSAILFSTRSVVLSGESRRTVERVAPCIISAARRVAEMPSAGFGLDSVVIEGHADRCGYEGWKQANEAGMAYAAGRAQAVYNAVFEQLVQDEELTRSGLREPVLARITTRSLGPYRPLKDSACDCRSDNAACEADRRVEIVVQGRVGDAAEPWAPPQAIPFIARRPELDAASAQVKEAVP